LRTTTWQASPGWTIAGRPRTVLFEPLLRGVETIGVLVVGWTRRVVNGRGTWLRWQSPQTFTRGDFNDAWLKADIWSQNPGVDELAREVAVVPLDDWQIFYFRENAWTNPQSSAAVIWPSKSGSAACATRLRMKKASRIKRNGSRARSWILRL